MRDGNRYEKKAYRLSSIAKFDQSKVTKMHRVRFAYQRLRTRRDHETRLLLCLHLFSAKIGSHLYCLDFYVC